MWDTRLPPANFLMLNPSKADEHRVDPTVAKCLRLARRWGMGGLVVTNIFALVSTDPQALYSHRDPVGEQNDEALLQVAETAKLVVCAWGTHGKFLGRAQHVQALLHQHIAPGKVYALKVNVDGSPAHPLYQKECDKSALLAYGSAPPR